MSNSQKVIKSNKWSQSHLRHTYTQKQKGRSRPQSPPHSPSRPSSKVPQPPPQFSNRVNRNAATTRTKSKQKKKKRPSLKSTQSMKDDSIVTDSLLPSSYKRNYRGTSYTPTTNANSDSIQPILHKSATVSHTNSKKTSVKASSSGSRWSNHPLYKDFDDQKTNKDKTPNTIKSKPPPPPKHGFMKALSLNSANKEREIRKYGQDIIGLNKDTLDGIDKCNMEHLMGALHEGSECLKNFKNALEKFSTAQQKNCANFLEKFKKSKKRYAKMDQMPKFFGAVLAVHSLLEETIKQSAEFAKFLQLECVPMIKSLDNQCDHKYKQIYNAKKEQDKKLNDLQADVNKYRKLSKAAAEKVIIARQRSEFLAQNEKYGQSVDSKKHKIQNDIKNAIMMNKHSSSDPVDDAYNNAKEQEVKFKAKISEYNAIRSEHIMQKNNSKHQLINMEYLRVDSMLKVFSKIVSQNAKWTEAKMGKILDLQSGIEQYTQSMNAKDVISNYVQLSVQKHGKWKDPPIMEAALDIEYRDMFHSIEDAMSITLEINPHVKIPLIVPLLCGRIRDLNGFSTEGIFRKSPNKSEMLRIKKRLQNKNFMLNDVNDVHIFAALLKEWLRGMADLMIPKRYYDYCVSMAKENKLNSQQFEVFFSQLPGANRECLKYLIKFLRELLKEENQKKTKMNLENIAIVFGPTLLMPPRQLEPMEALQNAKAEKQFVISLIEDS